MSPFKKYIIDKSFESTNFKFFISNKCGQNWYDVDYIGNSIEMKFIMKNMIKSGDIIFDCGAHQGYTSLLFSKWTGPNGEVHSFEPYISNYKILQKNILLNNSLNIFPYNIAIGNKKEICYMSRKSNSSVVNKKNGFQIKMIQLDNYANLLPNFIKIDVEGFEMKVLQGASNILSEGRTKFDIEIHPQEMNKYKSTVDELLSFLAKFKYEYFIQWNDNLEPTVYSGEEISKRVHLFLKPSKNRYFN